LSMFELWWIQISGYNQPKQAVFREFKFETESSVYFNVHGDLEEVQITKSVPNWILYLHHFPGSCSLSCYFFRAGNQFWDLLNFRNSPFGKHHRHRRSSPEPAAMLHSFSHASRLVAALPALIIQSSHQRLPSSCESDHHRGHVPFQADSRRVHVSSADCLNHSSLCALVARVKPRSVKGHCHHRRELQAIATVYPLLCR
jgi:hypothetical protein